jgi:hypothetical protein
MEKCHKKAKMTPKDNKRKCGLRRMDDTTRLIKYLYPKFIVEIEYSKKPY